MEQQLRSRRERLAVPHRQIEVEGGTLALLGLKTDLAVVQLNDLLGNVQPQACASLSAALGVCRLGKLLKDALLEGFWDPRAVVAYTHLRVLLLVQYRNLHRTTGRRKLGRVREQVSHHLQQAI